MDQMETVEFLSSPGCAFAGEEPVEVIETHTAYIFLCGNEALKLKRAVVYDYLDQSTSERRRAILERELELNQPAAPEIYRDVVPLTRGCQGLEFGGDEEAVDWVLRMWRFPAEDELEAIAEHGRFDDRLATATGEAIARYHAAAPVREGHGRDLIADILAELGRVFAEFENAPGANAVRAWKEAVAHALDDVGPLLDSRGAEGHIRRAHGDLHLRNLVLIGGRPVPFDALEFDETLGTCDVLYDIAFLVMDLCHRGLRRQACRVLDAWLRQARGAEDQGLAALPVFLSVRAAIRAMVLLQTDAAHGKPGAHASEVSGYLDLACEALSKTQPKLIAVGGYSGSGKSILARGLAQEVGALPGAALLSSDLERKAGMSATDRLGSESYAPRKRADVYEAMFVRAANILGSGHSVIVDATFLDEGLRTAAEAVAKTTGVPFRGLWLDTSAEALKARVQMRECDASDADLGVLKKQLASDPGRIAWLSLDASGEPQAVLNAAISAIA